MNKEQINRHVKKLKQEQNEIINQKAEEEEDNDYMSDNFLATM